MALCKFSIPGNCELSTWLDKIEKITFGHRFFKKKTIETSNGGNGFVLSQISHLIQNKQDVVFQRKFTSQKRLKL